MAIPSLRALGLGRTVKALGLGLLFLALWSWRRPGQERTKAMYAPMSVTQESRRALRGRVADAHPDLPVDNDNAQHLLKAMGGLDLRGRLGDLSCPVLVLYGSRDAVMVVGGEMLSARLPSAQVRVLPDVGHEPFIETPGETFAILRGFLVG